nr:hypothetical protein [Tanacetum cinerariifolium]
MPLYESEMTAKDVKSLAIRHDIPLDLHPITLTKGLTMDQLSDDMIVLYEQYFEFSGIRVPFSTFLLAVNKHFRIHISQLVPLGLNGLTMFELYCRSPGVVPSVNLFRVFYKKDHTGRYGLENHDSDVNDPVLEDGFSASDVQTLTERVVDFRHAPSGLFFGEGTWDFPGFHPIFKDTEGNVVTMSEYLRFPFLSGATISKGTALTSQDRIEQHTTRPLSLGQDILEKMDHHRRVEDGPAISGVTSSPKPIRTINHIDPSGTVAETVESREDRFHRVSLPGSANRYVHNYSDTHVNEETDTLRLGTSGDQSERAITNVNTEVVQPSPMHRPTHHSPTATRSASSPRGVVEPMVSLCARLVHPSEMPHGYPMWCQELMVHLAPSATQKESNALNNTTALERARFSLAREALAKTNILERFERLQTNFNQLAEAHSECGETVGKLVQASELSQVNKDQTLRIKELEDELARKDSALVYVERLNAKRAQEREKLVTQLSKTKMEKFDCVRKFLPTVVERLLQSHDYKQSLSEPFNLAIQAGWDKGLSEEHSEVDLLQLMGRMENFDVYADKKMRV